MNTNTKNDTMKALVLATGMLAAGAATTHGATVLGVTYSYDTLGTHNIVGKDNPDGTQQALTDGIGQSDTYTPAGYFWEPGNEGTIYGLNEGVGTTLQPGVTFDLGGMIELANVTIHYGVRQASGIPAPASVTLSVDGVPVGSFGGFDNSPNAADFGDIRSNMIDLTGQTGQFVTLDFLGNPDGSFTGLTEVEFTAVPEPGSALLLGLGGLGLLLRRRH